MRRQPTFALQGSASVVRSRLPASELGTRQGRAIPRIQDPSPSPVTRDNSSGQQRDAPPHLLWSLPGSTAQRLCAQLTVPHLLAHQGLGSSHLDVSPYLGQRGSGPHRGPKTRYLLVVDFFALEKPG